MPGSNLTDTLKTVSFILRIACPNFEMDSRPLLSDEELGQPPPPAHIHNLLHQISSETLPPYDPSGPSSSYRTSSLPSYVSSQQTRFKSEHFPKSKLLLDDRFVLHHRDTAEPASNSILDRIRSRYRALNARHEIPPLAYLYLLLMLGLTIFIGVGTSRSQSSD